MRLYTYLFNGEERVGAERGGYIYPTEFGSMLDAIRSDEIRVSYENGIAVEKAEIYAPIPVPERDVICLGINYAKHGAEAAQYNKEAFLREQPFAIYFSKRVDRAVAPGGIIKAHSDITERLDYECELAFIIEKDALDVKREDAAEYIFGYTILNDVSARDLQTRHKQWYFGKSLDGFTPMGPCIVTADEVAFPPKLDIKSYVNGELRQSSNTDYMVFDPAHVIAELSAGMTLRAGTIVATGTPEGVGMGFDTPKFLKAGDSVVCEIEKIGRLENTVEA